MIPLPLFFWILVVLFGVIGALRGWARELLVTFSMLVTLMSIHLLDTYLPGVLTGNGPKVDLGLRLLILVLLVFFGYQTPLKFGSGSSRREKLQNWILGFVLGLLNGYLIVGTAWYYLHQKDYLVNPKVEGYTKAMEQIFKWPDIDPMVKEQIERMMNYMPPRLVGEPWLYVAVTAAFIFVLIVFV